MKRPDLFQYNGRLTEGELRFLKLKPGHRDDCIECELDTFSTCAVEYTAISYVWGSPVRNQWIQCNGQRLDIASNLYVMLQRLREDYNDTNGSYLMWIDALCVKQDDLREKTLQVRRMAQTYQEAAKVVVWLGEEDESTEIGLGLLSRLCTAFPSSNGEDMRSLFLEVSQLPTPDSQEIIQSLGLPVPPSAEWSAVGKLLDAPWFSRRWVLQEIANSRFCGFRIGSFEVLPETVLGGIY